MKPRLYLFFSLILLAVSFAYLYRDTIVNLVKIWMDDEDYSHGFLVPLVAGYFIWMKRGELLQTPVKPFWPAIVPVFLAGLMLLAGQLSLHGFTQHFSLILMVYSLCLLVFGWRWLRILTVPLLFLVFMFPLPLFLKRGVSGPLQLLSSFISVKFLHLLHYPIYREGNILHLADTTLSVAEACSGIRSLVSLTFASAAIGYVTFKNKWKTFIPILFAIPVAVILNWVRISGTVILAEHWGAEAALKFFHDFSGIVVVLISIVIITAIIVVFKKREIRLSPSLPSVQQVVVPPKETSFRLPVAVVSSMLMIGLAFYGDLIFSSKPLQLDISKVPLEIGPYRGRDEKIDLRITLGTHVTQDRSIIFSNPGQPLIEVYMGYYRTGKDLPGFLHSPDTCIPGAGWEIVKKETVEILANGKENGKALKYLSRNGSTKQVMITWIQSGPRAEMDHREMIWNTFSEAMTQLRFDDATKIMISTNLGNHETEYEATKRLFEFIGDFYPSFIGISKTSYPG